MKRLLILLSILLITFNSTFAYKAVMFDGYYLPRHDKLTVMALAGIVNRDSARLYLTNIYETYSYLLTSQKWAEIFEEKGDVEFTKMTDIKELIDYFRDDIKGAITYDATLYYGNFGGQNFPWQGEFATMLAGLTDRLPVMEEDAIEFNLEIVDSVLVEDNFDGDESVWHTARLEKETHPWMKENISKEERYMTLLQHGIDNLLPLTNPSKFFIREITDFTVQQRMFHANLAGDDEGDIYSMPDNKANMLEGIFNYYHEKNPNTVYNVYGWIRPEPLSQWLATFGGVLHEVNFGNLSWHTSFPIQERVYTPPAAIDPEDVPFEDKFYVVFIGTEGDAGNWVYGLQGGAWLSEERGNVPVTWGWNFHLLDMCPFMASYYYDSGTANDGFISVTSPLGYAFTDAFPESVFDGATAEARRLMDKFGVNSIYGYKHYAPYPSINFRDKKITNNYNMTNYAAFQSAIEADVTYFFQTNYPDQTPKEKDGSIFFSHSGDDSFYGEAVNTSKMVDRILTSLKKKGSPALLLGGYQRFRQDMFNVRTDPSHADISIPILKDVVAELQADPEIGHKIEVVTIEKFSILVQKLIENPSLAIENIAINSNTDIKNFPNPFNEFTNINFDIAQSGSVRIEILDVHGRVIRKVDNKFYTKGSYQQRIDTKKLEPGIYFCYMKTKDATITRKMIKQ